MTSLYSFTLTDITGKELTLSSFEGQVVLIVNVASECGLTPQYQTLQNIYDKYAAQGLVILGIPCNQFGAQEPGTEQQIQQFCQSNYNITFPMTRKIDVNGPQRHSLYVWLAGDDAKYPGDISWNFEKFIIDRNGQVKTRFTPKTSPDAPELVKNIESLL